MGIFLVILSSSIVGFSYYYAWWNKKFFDILANRDFDVFFHECILFCLVSIFWALDLSSLFYYGQQYALNWRIWMTNKALNVWAYSSKRANLEGADQRIQEDLMRFTVIVERFFLEGFNAIITILVFTPILFKVTNNLSIGSIPVSIVILLSVIIYTGVGMYVGIKMTTPLIKLEYDSQKYEAAFRYNLVHAKDGKNISSISFLRLLSPIFKTYKAKYNKQRQFNLWLKIYNQFSFFIPFIILAPSYFSGSSTIGTLMEIRIIFAAIRSSMAYLLDHYTEFTELQAIAKRLFEFYNHLEEIAIERSTTNNNDQEKEITCTI
jgi:ABC-type long-subunit fatty acid transport system fused permease/ATPase subunit